jgi:hypothetical protein
MRKRVYAEFLLSYQIFMKPEASRQIFEKLKYQISLKIHPVGAKVFHADGRT